MSPAVTKIVFVEQLRLGRRQYILQTSRCIVLPFLKALVYDFFISEESLISRDEAVVVQILPAHRGL
jgi:hypothetical protein